MRSINDIVGMKIKNTCIEAESMVDCKSYENTQEE